MPQRFGLYEDLTVDENIAFFAELFGIARKDRDERAERLLAASGMTPFRRRRAGQLSGGMKQKLGLTCALIHTPRVLLLDEPTAGVDPVSRRDFWRILYGLRGEGLRSWSPPPTSTKPSAAGASGSCGPDECSIAIRRPR